MFDDDQPIDEQVGGGSAVEWVRPDVVLIALYGEMDMATVPCAATRLEQLIAERPKHLLLNLTDVTFFGSAAIGMPVTSCELTAHGQLQLIGVANNGVVGRVLDLAGVRALFAHHDDVAAALRDVDNTA